MLKLKDKMKRGYLIPVCYSNSLRYELYAAIKAVQYRNSTDVKIAVRPLEVA